MSNRQIFTCYIIVSRYVSYRMNVSRYVSYRRLHVSPHPLTMLQLEILEYLELQYVVHVISDYLLKKRATTTIYIYTFDCIHCIFLHGENGYTFFSYNFILILIYYILDQPILYLYWHQTGTTFQCLVHFDSKQFT